MVWNVTFGQALRAPWTTAFQASSLVPFSLGFYKGRTRALTALSLAVLAQDSGWNLPEATLWVSLCKPHALQCLCVVHNLLLGVVRWHQNLLPAWATSVVTFFPCPPSGRSSLEISNCQCVEASDALPMWCLRLSLLPIFPIVFETV